MKSTCRTAAIFLKGWFAVCLLVLPAMGQENTGEIDLWIARLSSGSYAERDRASQVLAGMGQEAIDPLISAIQSGDFETSFRALEILKILGLRSDLVTLEKIIIKTRQLPEGRRKQFVQWSENAVDNWRKNRSRQAVKNLEKKGISVEEVDPLNGMGLMLIDEFAVEIENARKKEPEVDVLDRISILKRELAGETVTPSGDGRRGAGGPPAVRIQLGERGAVFGRNPTVLSDLVNSKFTPKNVVLNKEWDGDVQGLMELVFVAGLYKVEFVERDITPAILNQLARIRRLRSVLLTRCKYSFAEVVRFQEQMKKYSPIQLLATGRGYLGVYGPNSGEPDDGSGSFVSLVSPNSAASEAGLERGDLIVQVDDDSIRSFAELSLVISSKPVGNAIRIVVNRKGQRKVLEAMLKSRAGLQ